MNEEFEKIKQEIAKLATKIDNLEQNNNQDYYPDVIESKTMLEWLKNLPGYHPDSFLRCVNKVELNMKNLSRRTKCSTYKNLSFEEDGLFRLSHRSGIKISCATYHFNNDTKSINYYFETTQVHNLSPKFWDGKTRTSYYPLIDRSVTGDGANVYHMSNLSYFSAVFGAYCTDLLDQLQKFAGALYENRINQKMEIVTIGARADLPKLCLNTIGFTYYTQQYTDSERDQHPKFKGKF